jgi:steroid 5-alpha reductase family enzyme
MMADATDNAFIAKLQQFYESAKFQHKISFWASLIAAAVGFIAILLAFLVFVVSPGSVKESAIIAISGALSEFVAAAFFYIHNKNIGQVDVCIQKLVKLQDTRLAISLVEKMPENNRAYMYMTIINILILRNEPQKDISPDLVRALRERGGNV